MARILCKIEQLDKNKFKCNVHLVLTEEEQSVSWMSETDVQMFRLMPNLEAFANLALTGDLPRSSGAYEKGYVTHFEEIATAFKFEDEVVQALRSRVELIKKMLAMKEQLGKDRQIDL